MINKTLAWFNDDFMRVIWLATGVFLMTLTVLRLTNAFQ